MLLSFIKKTVLIGLFAFTVSCSEEAKFASGTEDPTAEKNTDDTNKGEATSNQCDLTQDFVQVSFPANIQACIDQGNIFDFYTNDCSPIKASTSYECNFDSLRAKLTDLGMSTASIDDAISKNAKLISCGEKRAGLSVITQWWYPTEEQINAENCSYSADMVLTTGCFQQNNGDGTKTTADNEAEKSEIIKACLK